MKRLFNNKGETYIDVAITVMIVAFVLVFSVNMVSLVALNQNVKTMADQIADYATVKGTTDVGDYINSLRSQSGIDFSCSFSGTAFVLCLSFINYNLFFMLHRRCLRAYLR